MKTSLSTADLHSSVIAVPPLARDAQLQSSAAENAKVLRHIESGGVKTMLYGGNANFYNIAMGEYETVLDQLEAGAAADTLIVPSIGPYYGTAIEQAALLAKRKFPTAMLLPTVAVSSPEGVRNAVLKIVETLGRPIVLYIKDAGYVTLDVVKSLVDAGAISWIKYAVVRADPAQDELLAGLVLTVNPAMIVSGIGEQPAIVHWEKFGIRAFTSGCVCVAPRRSQEMLLALQAGDFAKAEEIRVRFDALESLRNTYGPIPVLHHAVAQAGIAQTGPMLPLLANLKDDVIDEIHPAAEGLLKWNAA